jgi:hypothetical protein
LETELLVVIPANHAPPNLNSLTLIHEDAAKCLQMKHTTEEMKKKI